MRKTRLQKLKSQPEYARLETEAELQEAYEKELQKRIVVDPLYLATPKKTRPNIHARLSG